jgi:tetratricopeptide (TPR) repeat protein
LAASDLETVDRCGSLEETLSVWEGSSQMMLASALFKDRWLAYQVVNEIDEFQDFNDWELLPLSGQTLAQEDVQGPFQGVFIIAAQAIRTDGPAIPCYLDVVLPERIVDHHYMQTDKGIFRGNGRRLANGTVIPAIGVESPGVYKLFYAREDPEAGIKVLKDALLKGHRKRDIAYDLGLLLRDQKKYREAIDAFSTFLTENPWEGIADTVYKERSKLYAALGQTDKAEDDQRNFAAAFEKKYGHAPKTHEI